MITNNVTCFDKINDRVKSRLGGMPRILFPPYNAIQIGDILQKRVAVGFNEGVFEDMVAPRIAAIAAQEHGDVRKAISLLRAIGEIASSLPCHLKRDMPSWPSAMLSGNSMRSMSGPPPSRKNI
jgi:Cdc6-like AAA superfamily ATPase